MYEMSSLTNPPTDALLEMAEEFSNGKLSRRDFVRRGAALGASLPSIAAVLSSCNGNHGKRSATESASIHHSKGNQKSGGILREGYDRDFSRLDPINSTYYDPAFFALYEAVITRDNDRRWVPELAERWEQSPDGLAWTFKIRTGLKFHSGAPLDAAVIADVFNAVIDPESASPQRAMWAPIVETVALDATTFQIRLKHPFANLPNVVSNGYSRIVNLALRKELGKDYGMQVVDGSGPFRFVEWAPGDHVTVKRWDDYPGSIVPFIRNRGKAHLDGIEWSYVPEVAMRALMIQNQELDTLKGPAFQDIARLRTDPNLVVTEVQELALWSLGLNFERLSFSDLKVRQAISQCLDRQVMVDHLLFGHGKASYGPIPKSSPDYDSAVEEFNRHDPAGARRLMAEAGWTPGKDGILAKHGTRFSFELVVSTDSFERQLAAVVQEQLRSLGLELRIRSLDNASKFAAMTSGVDAFLFNYSWPNCYDVYIIISISTSAPYPNWQRANLPDLDAAHAAYTNASTAEQLQAASSKGQVVGARQLPFVPLFNPATAWVSQKYVRNYLPIPWNLYPYYNDVWLDM